MANETKIVITAATAQAEGALRGFSSSLDGLGGKIRNFSGLLGGLGGALSITAFAGFIKSTINAADNLNDLAQKTGIGIEALAGYKLAAEQSGTSLESVAKGVKGLSAYMIDHADKLKKLGVTATDSNGAMVQLADVFKMLPDGVEKSKLAVDVFGKAGMDMIPMLNLGSQGLAEAQEKAAEYGRRMKELAPDADKFNDQLAELALQASVVGINLASLVTGPMAQWLEANNQAIRIAGGVTEALRLFVFNLDAMTSEKPVEEIKRLTKALEDYQAASSIGKFMQSPTGFLFGGREDDLKKQITFLEFLKKQEERAAQPAKTTSAQTPEQAAADILKQRAFAAEVRKIIGDDKTPKAKKDKPFDPEGDFWFAVDEAAMKNQKKRNEQYLTDLEKAQEEANAEIRSSALKAQAIIADTDPIYKAGLAWEDLTYLIERGFITAEQAGKYYAQSFGESTDQMTEFAKRAGQNIQDAFADFLFDPFDGGVQGMLDGFTTMLRKMAAEALASQILGSIGAWGKTGGGAGSVIGDIVGSVFGKNAQGGAYAGAGIGAYSNTIVNKPTLFPFARGIGLMGEKPGSPGEAIMPLSRMPGGDLGVKVSGGAQQITVINNFTLSQPADRRTQEQIAAMAGASIQSAMMRGA